MTTSTKRARTRKRRERSPSEIALSVTLFIGIVGTLLIFAGVTPVARIWGSFWMALSLGSVLLMPAGYIRAGAVALRVSAAGGLLMGAALLGLLPIPGFLQGVVAPGWAEARGSTHLLASADSTATLEMFFRIALCTSAAFATAIWAGRSRARRYGWYVIYGVTIAIALLAASFVLRGSRGYFGVPVGGNMRFFAPFVNPNHFGSFLCLVYPFAVGRALSPREGHIPQWAGALVAFILLGGAVWAGSTGPLIILGVQTIGLFWYERSIPLWLVVFSSFLGLVGLLVVVSTGAIEGVFDLNGRIATWRSSVWMGLDHWLLGTGAGTYGDQLLPYRTDQTPEFWGFAHNDWLEWIVTTGLVGTVALVAALVLIRPRPRQAGQGGRYTNIGLAGLFVHAAVDFPFQLLGLAMMAAAILAWRMVVYDRYGRSQAWMVRGVAAALLFTQVAGAAHFYRTKQVDDYVEWMATLPRGSDWHKLALDTLERWGPGIPELAIEKAIIETRAGATDAADARLTRLADDFRGSARVLASVAQVRSLRGEHDEARALIERAVERSPSDWRYWEIRAELIEKADPTQAPAAWKDALRHQAPRALRRGYAALPLGVYWVDALGGRSAAAHRRLASFLLKRGEEEAAFLAFQIAQQKEPAVHSIDHARLLVKYAPDAATPFLEASMKQGGGQPEMKALYAENLEERGRLGEALEVWRSLAHSDPDARYRLARLLWRHEGAAAALLELERARVRGEDLTDQSVYLKAELHSSLGNGARCLETLASSGLLDRKRTRKRTQLAMEACSATGEPL